MDNIIEIFVNQLNSVRAGRANVAMLDGIKVDYYGSANLISQVASITVLDSCTLLIKPWEKSKIVNIEKSIIESNYGFVPINDGHVIRVPIPSLTEERRMFFVKQIKKKVEDTKISIRKVRRFGNEAFKLEAKNKSISKDDEKKKIKEMQKITNKYISSIDKIFNKKVKEICDF